MGNSFCGPSICCIDVRLQRFLEAFDTLIMLIYKRIRLRRTFPPEVFCTLFLIFIAVRSTLAQTCLVLQFFLGIDSGLF